MRSASMVWCPYFIKLSIFCATLLLYVFFLQFVLPRADVLITQPIEEVWRNRNFESLDKVKWTNVGLRSGVFRTYPGHRSTRGYDPTEYVTTRNYLCHTYHKCITILSIAVSLTFIAFLINVPLTVVNYLLLLFLKYLTVFCVFDELSKVAKHIIFNCCSHHGCCYTSQRGLSTGAPGINAQAQHHTKHQSPPPTWTQQV